MDVFTQGSNFLDWRVENETVRVIAWGNNSLRVISCPNGEPDMNCSALLQKPDSNLSVTITENKAVVVNGDIKAVIDLSKNRTGQLAFYNQNNQLLIKELDDGGALKFKARQFNSINGTTFQLKAFFQSNPNERIYGMGQYQQDFMNLKGCSLELAQRNSQVSIPFYVSDQGYGFFWHNPAIGSVSFALNCTEWQAAATNQLDYWITAGDSPKQLISQFAEVTGHAPQMPEYGLGFWQSKLRYATQQEVLDVAREYHRRNIPLDVLVIDYYHWPRCGDYRFDEQSFPNPKAMVAELERYGIKLMVSVWPQIDTRSENFDEMKRNGYLVQTTQGIDTQMLFHGNNVFYDATNPQARRYVWNKIKKNYYDQGIKLFWLDEAEPEFGTYDFSLYRYFKGPALTCSNLYPREYIRGFAEGEEQENSAPTVKLVRCAWAGSQKYGALVWSGDIRSNWQTLRNQIIAGLQIGISGIPWWTTDIGGFHDGAIDDPAFQELMIRWFQFGTFCPVMRTHGSRRPHRAIYKPNGEETERTGAPNEVWSYGEANLKIMDKFIHIREKLRPYLRQVMLQAHNTGIPVIRATFIEFPSDETTWNLRDEYLLGADLLVAPITHASETMRQVYLPKGAVWTDARDGKRYDGGQWVNAAADITTLPIFTRNDSLKELIGLL